MIMKRKLIIHIGMGKTGSSSIQKTLRRGQESLIKNGMQYLGLMLEHAPFGTEAYSWQKASGWPVFLSQDTRLSNNQLIDALIKTDKLLADNIHTLIWSNESFFEGGNRVLTALETVKEIFDIEIVGYIRRPDSWIMSAYLQWGIKHKSYAGPLKPFKKWSLNRSYNIIQNIELWESLHSQAKFFNFDALQDIAHHFNTVYLPNAVNEIPSLRENETPSPVAMALFAYHNSLSEKQVLPSELEPLLNRSGVIGKTQRARAYNNLLPNEEDIKNYIDGNHDEIAQVNKYLQSHGEPAFELNEIKIKDYSTNQHEVNRALLQIIKQLSNEVDELRKKISQT